MDYNKLDKTLEKLGRTKQEVINSAGLNEQWYYKAIKKGSMRIEDLEKLTEALGIQMEYWWTEANESMVKDIGISKYNRIANREVKELEEKVKNLNETIINLNEYILSLKDKLSIYEHRKQKTG